MPVDKRPAHHIRCRACKAWVFFAITPALKSCPFDSEPVPDGDYVIEAWGVQSSKGDFPVAQTFMGKAADCDDPDEPRFVSHFKTCTSPSRFSKKTQAKPTEEQVPF